MGGQIPRPIKVEVIRKWLDGKSRDQIANEVGIAAGSVSSILKESRRNDAEFDLMRELAVKLKKNQGNKLESFVSAVRSREILRRLLLDTPTTVVEEGGGGETREEEHDDDSIRTQQQEVEEKLEEKIESFIVALEVFFFKQNLSIKQFVDLVYRLYSIAERFGVPLEQLPSYIEGLENKLDRLKEEIEDINLKKQNTLENSGTTLELLEEFKANRPLFQKLRQQLDKLKKERDSYKIRLENERAEKIIGEQIDKEIERIESGISEEELDNANTKQKLQISCINFDEKDYS